ncbi:MAG: nickel pincer cofactor biosynthesis protein LarB [Magnetococcus sp. WYHC-3]
MTPQDIQALLEQVARGQCAVDRAMALFREFPSRAVRHGSEVVARLDTGRGLRQGFPEVILAQGKNWEHLASVVSAAQERPGPLLVTRVSPARARRLCKNHADLAWDADARMVYRLPQKEDPQGLVAVLCAGTSDVGVAREAALTARLMGARVACRFDVGVAGLHRLLAEEELLATARVLVVVAGMEGALPSVVGGLVDRPVVAVPTSQGYGVSLGGVAALLGMLGSCAANVTTVNIDNGFGAGYVAALINRT